MLHLGGAEAGNSVKLSCWKKVPSAESTFSRRRSRADWYATTLSEKPYLRQHGRLDSQRPGRQQNRLLLTRQQIAMTAREYSRRVKPVESRAANQKHRRLGVQIAIARTALTAQMYKCRLYEQYEQIYGTIISQSRYDRQEDHRSMKCHKPFRYEIRQWLYCNNGQNGVCSRGRLLCRGKPFTNLRHDQMYLQCHYFRTATVKRQSGDGLFLIMGEMSKSIRCRWIQIVRVYS